MIDKQLCVKALRQAGFCDWQSPLMKEKLQRPRRRPENLPGVGRVAAVLLLLYRPGIDSELSLVLTRRNAKLKRHAGQISFPGGRQDPGESLVDTALRESQEEIGIDIGAVEILGPLNSLYIPPSDFTIYPFVGWHAGQPQFRLAPYEVSEIIAVPVEPLLANRNLQFGRIDSEKSEIQADYYAIAGCQVWGATAIVISEFVERIRVASQQH